MLPSGDQGWGELLIMALVTRGFSPVKKRSVLTPIGVVFWWVGRDELDGPANPAVILERARSSSGFHR